MKRFKLLALFAVVAVFGLAMMFGAIVYSGNQSHAGFSESFVTVETVSETDDNDNVLGALCPTCGEHDCDGHASFPGWAIALIVVGGIIVVAGIGCIVYYVVGKKKCDKIIEERCEKEIQELEKQEQEQSELPQL